MPPTTGQMALLMISLLLFAVAGGMAVARLWKESRAILAGVPLFTSLGMGMAMGVLVWHAQQRGRWIPLDDNFDALIWMGLLLAMFMLYVQRRKPLGGLELFILPLVILLLVGAAYFGKSNPHPYLADTWSWVHRVSSYVGAVAFAFAGVGGAMYLMAARRLRSKMPIAGQMGSLERLEHLTMVSVTLGFALLTVGLITGLVKMIAAGQDTPTSKIILACAVWLVYATVLHSPINPSFRGRKVAILSVVGFVLMIGTIATVMMLPGGQG